VPYPRSRLFRADAVSLERARTGRACTRWLISIQLDNGAFAASDGTPYTFDTGQVLRGLCAAAGDVDGAQEALRKAGDWLLTQVSDSGRMTTPSVALWGDIASDLIHTYVLPRWSRPAASRRRPYGKRLGARCPTTGRKPGGVTESAAQAT